MYTLLSEINNVINQKKEYLQVAKEKKESLVKSLCNQQQAIDNLEHNIADLESEHKALWAIHWSGQKDKPMPGRQDTYTEVSDKTTANSGSKLRNSND